MGDVLRSQLLPSGRSLGQGGAGASTLGEYLKATVPFSLEGRLDAISCPTALTAAEADPLARSVDQVYEGLRQQKGPPAPHHPQRA